MATPKTGNGNGGKSHTDTINEATGTHVADGENDIQPIGDVTAMFSSFTPQEIAQAASSGKVEFAPQNARIKIGQKVSGHLEGEGPGADFDDKDTGKTRHVRSWIIRAGALRVAILSSAQLDKKLEPFVGSNVHIARNEDIQLAGGHRCADYMVWGDKKADGQPRSFVTLPGQRQATLPAGAAIDVIETANHEHAS